MYPFWNLTPQVHFWVVLQISHHLLSSWKDPIFEVVSILNSKIVRNKLYYLVDWVCYTPNDRTWEPVGNLANVVDMVTAFHC